MEIAARRLAAVLPGETVESALAPGINALKTFDPPLHALEGRAFTGVSRRGKLLLLELDDLVLLLHLMSAGRIQLYDKRASLRDRTSRLLLRLPGDRELRVREFGSKQAAWVKLLRAERRWRPRSRYAVSTSSRRTRAFPVRVMRPRRCLSLLESSPGTSPT